MIKRLFLYVIFIILPCVSYAGVELPKQLPDHPRLFMKPSEVQGVKNLIETDIYAKRVDSAVVAYCDKVLFEPLPGDELDAAGVRLKNVGVIDKQLVLLTYASKIHDNEEYKDRAIQLTMNVCAFKDWGPEHFLDPSQLSFGVCFCFDWLYDCFTAKQRKIVKNALLYKAIMPSFEKHPNHYFFGGSNWNSVCNCGSVAAALMVYEDYPYEAGKVIDRCVEGNKKVLATYNPIGAYPEGFGYWAFGTNHEVMVLDMLNLNFGTDFGLANSTPGFMNTSKFILHMTGPFGIGFNYGDNAPNTRLHPAAFWFAKENYDPSLLYLEQKFILSGADITVGSGYAIPAMLVWYSKIGGSMVKVPSELFYENVDPRIPLFIYRSNWDSENAAYLGIRAGSVRKVGHCHIDVGSFVYYRDKVRWVTELGVANYVLAEKHLGHLPFFTLTQDSPRWTVLRECADGHSIVTFDGIRPTVDCNCPFLKTFRTRAMKGAMMDLTSMYPEQVSKYIRLVNLDANDDLAVNEKFVGTDQDHKVKWNLVTESNATLQEDGTVLLEKDGKQKRITISTADCPIDIKVVEPKTDKPWDQPNPDMCFVQCEFTLKAGSTVNLITTLK